MTTILTIICAITLFIFFAKKPIWKALPLADKVSYKESFFYWFTASDLMHPKYKPFRWAIVLNNVLNIIMAIVCILLVIWFAIKFLTFIS
jgi:hypothetical protein